MKHGKRNYKRRTEEAEYSAAGRDRRCVCYPPLIGQSVFFEMILGTADAIYLELAFQARVRFRAP